MIAVVRAWQKKQIRDPKAIPAWVRTVTRRQFIAMINEIRPDSDPELLEKIGWSPEGEVVAPDSQEEQGLLPLLRAASIQGRVAQGPDAGQRLARVALAKPRKEPSSPRL